jgi:fatty-acyl-CoA synthase
MSTLERLRTLGTELQAVGRVAMRRLPILRPGAHTSVATLLAEQARRRGDRIALRFEERAYTWADFDRQVNRTAHAFREIGVERGDAVALLMDNRPEFLFALTALSRLGAVAALINTNVSGPALLHAVGAGQAVALLAGAEHREKVEEIVPELGFECIYAQRDGQDEERGTLADFDALVDKAPDREPQALPSPRIEDRACYIYTSGTTGLPKAAIITNARLLQAGALFADAILDLGPDDVNYVALPLYHSNAMFAGFSAGLLSGATTALRRKFSASRFWEDVRRFDATTFIYIGELCRYLLSQPESPEDGKHRLRAITGNGLRPDIWETFQRRFRVPLIREFYGATEGVMGSVNFEGRPGMVGRMLPGSAVIRCDLETGEIVRDRDGRCSRVAEGGTGLLVQKIATSYDGYVDEKATKKKILTDVFADGDRYFDSGDLITLHPDRWLSFADRVGDTFRWKGENVSTNEVAEILNGAAGVLESNVYGVEVPGSEGRAGMASLRVDDAFDLASFARFVTERLPGFQRPYFVRILHDMRITGTFKHQKVDYRREGFDPAKVGDPLHYLDGERYVTLDAEAYEGIRSGRIVLR